MYLRALAIREKDLGPDHLDVASALEHHARILRNLGRRADASEKASRAFAIRERAIREAWREQPKASAQRVGRAITPPRVISQVRPEYSEEARIFRHEGSVELQFEVWADGRAHNIELRFEGLGLGLDEKAAEAVRQWRFEPAMEGGKPVPVKIPVRIYFREPGR